MAAGLISEESFRRCALDFERRAKFVGDTWSIYEHAEKVYLYKKVAQQIPRDISDLTDAGIHSTEKEEVVEEDDDAHLANTASHGGQTLVFEYHVLYSESYSVPVMYFNIHLSDGRLLPLDKVWQLVPEAYQQRLQKDRWTFITQQEHPYLGRPFYQLHPCHTEALMSCVDSMTQQGCMNYLISWLSVVGPVVLLDMPLAYGKMPD